MCPLSCFQKYENRKRPKKDCLEVWLDYRAKWDVSLHHWIINIQFMTQFFKIDFLLLLGQFLNQMLIKKRNSCRNSQFLEWRMWSKKSRNAQSHSVIITLPSPRLLSITNLSAWTNVIFLSCSYQMLLPPCVSTTLILEINARPMEAETKTVITHKATNSLALTAYFIHYCK